MENIFIDSMVDAMLEAFATMKEEGIEVICDGDDYAFACNTERNIRCTTDEEVALYEQQRRHFAPENRTEEEIKAHGPSESVTA